MNTRTDGKTPLRAVLWVSVSTAPQAADDKLSLPTQEQAARELCDRKGWQPVDVLVVDGHSRRYIDIRECARDMEAKGITAFTRLMEHWKARDFDVLIVRDASRFARTQALHAYVVESTIDAGATLYSLQDGPIDETNYRMWTAMAGYAAASEMDRLRKLQKEAYRRAAARGLPLHRMPDTHRKVRDERGRAIGVEVVPAQREFYTRAGELLLEGVSWSQLGEALYTRFGAVNPRTGRPMLPAGIYRRLYSGPFWGHVVSGTSARKMLDHRDLWMIDPAYRDEAPDGVTVHYDVLPPVLDGDFAARVKAELIRRMSSGRRKHKPVHVYRYSGLLLCGACGRRMIASYDHYTPRTPRARPLVRYKCSGAKRPGGPCRVGIMVRESVIDDWLDTLLRRLMRVSDPETFSGLGESNAETAQRQLEHVERTVSDLDARMRRTALRLSETDDPVIIASITHVLQELSEQRTAADKARAQLLASVPSEEQQQAVRTAFDDVRTLGLTAFWAQPALRINQLLHRLLGPRRGIVVRDGNPAGIGRAAYRPKRLR